jgi:hypothetical protein
MRKYIIGGLAALGTAAIVATGYSAIAVGVAGFLIVAAAIAIVSLASTAKEVMALTLPPTFPARNSGEQNMHFFRKRIQFADVTALTAGLKIGRLPSRAFVTGVEVHTGTSFNAATTATISVGTTAATGTEICAAQDVKTTGYIRVASPTGAGLAVTASGEVDVFLKFAQTGGSMTTGDATVIVHYMPDNDQ